MPSSRWPGSPPPGRPRGRSASCAGIAAPGGARSTSQSLSAWPGLKVNVAERPVLCVGPSTWPNHLAWQVVERQEASLPRSVQPASGRPLSGEGECRAVAQRQQERGRDRGDPQRIARLVAAEGRDEQVRVPVRGQRPGDDLVPGARPVQDGQGHGDRPELGGQLGCLSRGHRRCRAERGSEPDRPGPRTGQGRRQHGPRQAAGWRDGAEQAAWRQRRLIGRAAGRPGLPGLSRPRAPRRDSPGCRTPPPSRASRPSRR